MSYSMDFNSVASSVSCAVFVSWSCPQWEHGLKMNVRFRRILIGTQSPPLLWQYSQSKGYRQLPRKACSDKAVEGSRMLESEPRFLQQFLVDASFILLGWFRCQRRWVWTVASLA